MKKIKSAVLVAGLLTGMAASNLSVGADTGWYGGISAGRTSFGATSSELGLSSGTVDDKDTGWKIYGGYQINQTWGAELGYYRLGKLSLTGNILGTPVTGNVEVNGLNFSGVGTLPINKNFSAFGKLGFFSSRAKASVSAGTLSAAATDNSTNISYGLGVGYTLNQSLGLQAEWERVDGKGSDNVDLLSAGVSYKFK